MKLFFREYGTGDKPLLILHGLFGSSRNWHSIAQQLSEYHVYVPDARNHGASPWAGDMNYAVMVEDVLTFIDKHALGQVIVCGHSMGGKTAMLAALQYPERVRALVVVDIAPVKYAHDFDAFITAMQAVDPATITRRSEADAALGEMIDDPYIRSFLLQNLVASEGRYQWRLNLQVLADAMPLIADFPGADTSYTGPVLFLGGSRSGYVKPAFHEDIYRLFPNAEIETIAAAGHWLHAEQPGVFLARMHDFLAGV